MWIHKTGMGTFDLHELIECVSEGYFSELICADNVGIETFDLHELTLHDAFQNPLEVITLVTSGPAAAKNK